MDILCAGTLGALSNVKLDRLAFVQFFEGRALDRRAVKEELVSIALDETESLVRHYLLNCS